MMRARIALLCANSETSRIAYHYLKEYVDVAVVVAEEPVRPYTVLRRRIRRLGIYPAVGQALFAAVLMPLIRRLSQERLREIMTQYKLDDTSIPEGLCNTVLSVNDPEAAAIIQKAQVSYVVVWGTRLLSAKTIQAIGVPIINIHVGITPRYRGSHGGYWALYHRDQTHCGVTVHLIDTGIDTGGILAQRTITPTLQDTIATYPLLQLVEGLGAVVAYLNAPTPVQVVPIGTPSGLWFHPTLFQYIRGWLRGVK
jgi:hypothetical protein